MEQPIERTTNPAARRAQIWLVFGYSEAAPNLGVADHLVIARERGEQEDNVKPIRASMMLLSCVAFCFVTAPAFAQALNYTSVEAIAGKPVQLTYHADAHKSTCTAAPIPTLRVIEPPKDGVLTVRKAVLTTDKLAGCPGLKVPALVVFYQAKERYSGSDHVSYAVTNAAGQTQGYDVTITVKPAPPDGVPESPKQPKGNSL
jgi:hypothetical protein